MGWFVMTPDTNTLTAEVRSPMTPGGRAKAGAAQDHLAVLESLGVAVVATDAAGRLTFYNDAAAEMWGWRPILREQRWCGAWRLFTAEGAPMPHDTSALAVCLRERRPVRNIWAYAERPDGTRIPFAPVATPLLDAAGVLVGAVNVLVDISSARAVADQLRRSESRFHAAQGLSPDGFVVLEPLADADGRVTDFEVSYANQAATGLLARPLAGRALQGMRLATLLPDLAGGPDGLTQAYADVIRTGAPADREFCLAAAGAPTHDGRTGKWFRSRAVQSGEGVGVVFQNITIRRRAETRARFLAQHDGLTGLPNRNGLQRALSQVLSAPARPAILLLLDIDRFKTINDSLGHAAGDTLLRDMGRRLRDAAGETAVVARLTGPEFGVLVTPEDAGREAAAELAEAIVAALAPPFTVEGQAVALGVRIGIARAPADGSDAGLLLRNADRALYRAKAEDHCRWTFFDAAMDEEASRRRLLEMDLRRAMQVGGEFMLHYQPVYDAASRRITGMEALLRWQHPTRGMVSPGEFIPLAEQIGLIVPLGEHVLRTACAEAAGWDKPLRIAVNLSPAQFRQPDLLAVVNDALAQSGLDPHRLELEVTEALLLQDAESVRGVLDALRALGVQVALDDFGTGYSSLSYLHSFPFDRVKIDRSFVRDIATRPRSAAIVRAVASLAADLDLAVTAEGIETEQELAIVRDAGCGELQGFLLSRPRAVADIQHLVTA
jgi:diguanylate cyclase (GGDEF)-like protein